MIEIRSGALGYRRWRTIRVLTVDISVPAGVIAAFIGRNGAGKTTLFRTTLGFLPLIEGAITIDELPPTEFIRRNPTGYVPEAAALPLHWTSREVLRAAARVGGAAGTRDLDRVATLLHLVDLDTPLARLSKGQRQRVLIGAALLPRPRLLVLDEPEAGLDPAQRVAFREVLRGLADNGSTVLLASHDMSLVTIADTVTALVDGRAKQLAGHEVNDPDGLADILGPRGD